MDEDMRVWNAAVAARPAAVRRCEDPRQVSDALREARASGLAVSVLGAGHDWAGRAVRAGGMVIDLRGMPSVRVERDTAIVSGGSTAGDVTAASAPSGQTAATGIVGAVGMAGLTMGGGYGPITGVAGLAADNLVEAEVVLADGTVTMASEAEDADLLWALRGGGGNFGVVTSLRVRLYAIPSLYRGMIFFPLEQAADVLAGYREIAAELPDELTVQAGAMTAPSGAAVLLLAPSWSGRPEDGADWVKRVEGLGRPVASHVASHRYADVLRTADERFAPDDRHYAIRTVNLAGLTTDTVAALMAAGSSRTSPLSALNLHHFHGAPTRVPVTQTAFGLRTEHYMTEIIACWRPTDHPDESAHRRWADETAEMLAPHALPGGYPNLLGPDHVEQAARAYGPNAARLSALKESYDPDHVFSATPLPPRS